ncbi:MAG TPA: pseudouridine synthase [Gammaproteobacteria bacterium]|nr:pseudouridine synthase [Gammaproteobacteria bacterium]
MEREAADRPERLLAGLGIASRREIARWIAAGRLAAGGRVLRGGERIRASDRLTLDGKPLILPAEQAARRVLLYHKPVGEIVSRHDPDGRPSVFAALPPLRGGRWITVGRLDITTAGLLLFSSDGALAARLMHPRYGIERRYLVRVHGDAPPQRIEELTRGVRLEDGMARLSACAPLAKRPNDAANRWYRVSLEEGRNRELRRIFAAVGLEVSRLKRIGYGPISLPRGLPAGSWVELAAGEIAALDAAVGGHEA